MGLNGFLCCVADILVPSVIRWQPYIPIHFKEMVYPFVPLNFH